MQSIEHSIQALTEHFNSRMAEFQKSIQGTIPATSPTSNIASQFSTFRVFVMSALEDIQLQVKLLSRQVDQMEMRSRRKILLIHGIPEENGENTSVTVSKILANHLKLPVLKEECFSRSVRIGSSKGNRPRPILMKFHDLALRNQVWYSKTSLKNTGVTLSEFLTKDRHDAFMAARQKFGIGKCWTKDGFIIITSPDGQRHRVVTLMEVNSINVLSNVDQVPAPIVVVPGTSTSAVPKPTNPSQVIRSKRANKK